MMPTSISAPHMAPANVIAVHGVPPYAVEGHWLPIGLTELVELVAAALAETKTLCQVDLHK